MAYAQSDLTKLRRSAKRGSYDKEVVSSILDAALVAHVAARRHQKRGDSRTPRPLWRMGSHATAP